MYGIARLEARFDTLKLSQRRLDLRLPIHDAQELTHPAMALDDRASETITLVGAPLEDDEIS